jgi:hypothetical protein
MPSPSRTFSARRSRLRWYTPVSAG